ncbi:hypothetical protein, partial [Moorena sp. SIO3H5]|uniref:hypothetical protein n=1 Tax=Moorena sp. SIO3H5 TaxID=2607834 RepID=UPI0025EDF996
HVSKGLECPILLVALCPSRQLALGTTMEQAIALDSSHRSEYQPALVDNPSSRFQVAHLQSLGILWKYPSCNLQNGSVLQVVMPCNIYP